MARVAVANRVAIPERMNYITQPNDLTNAAWIKVSVTATADADAGPSAATLALASVFADVTTLPLDGMIPDAGAGVNAVVVQAYSTPTGANRKRYTVGCIVKAGPLNSYGVFLSPDGGATGAYFNLTNGTIGTIAAVTATITTIETGYYLITATLAEAAFTPTLGLYCASADGVATVSTGNGTIWVYAGGFMATSANRIGPLTMNGTPLTPPIRSLQ